MTLTNGTLTAGQKRRTQTTGKSYGCLILLEKGSSTDCVSSASPTLVRLGDGWWQGGGGGGGGGGGRGFVRHIRSGRFHCCFGCALNWKRDWRKQSALQALIFKKPILYRKTSNKGNLFTEIKKIQRMKLKRM